MSFGRPKTFAAGALAVGAGVYAGYSLRETSGSAAATVRLWDNASAASGTLVATVGFASAASKDFVAPEGVWFVNGLFAEVVTGAVEGSVYFG